MGQGTQNTTAKSPTALSTVAGVPAMYITVVAVAVIVLFVLGLAFRGVHVSAAASASV